MKRALVVGLALAMILVPVPINAQEDTQEWPPWHKPDEFKVRVPISVGLGDHYPSDWDGPRLVAHELDATQALIDAGWPTDDATGLPQRFSVDEDSVRVVADPEEDPIPAIVWDGALLSGPQAFPPSHDIVTVAFLAPEDASDLHVYFDRTEDGASEPLSVPPVEEAKIMQLLAGPGAGHELYGVVEGNSIDVLVTGGSSTTITAERLTSQGWSSFGCSGQTVGQNPGSWARCTVSGAQGPTPIRILAEKPVSAYTWDSGADVGRFIPLAGTTGTQDGTQLTVPHVEGTDPTVVKLMGVSEACEGTLGNTELTIPVGTPTTHQINQPRRLDADCRVLGWIPGEGVASMPTAIDANFTTAAATNTRVDGENQRITAAGDQGASVELFNPNTGAEQTKILLEGEPRLADQPFRGASWRMTSEDSYILQAEGAALWPALWGATDDPSGVLPLGPSAEGTATWLGHAAAGSELQLVGLTRAGDADVTMAVNGDRIESTRGVSETILYGPHEGQVPDSGGLAEAWTSDDRLLFSYALLGDDKPLSPPLLSAFLKPVETTEGTPQAIGPLFDLELDPESRIAAPGEVERFDLLGSGAIRNADGSLEDLEIQINVDAFTDSEEAPEIDLTLRPTARATLPQGEAEKLVTVEATIPSEVPPGSKPVYTLVATGTPVDGGDPIQTQASLQIVPDRAISLTFEDGSSLKDFQTEDGEVTAPLILQNDGTDVEPVALSTTVPQVQGYDVELLDARTETPISTTDLAPGERKRLLLHVTTDTEGPLILNIKASARSLIDASTTSDVTARVTHGVSVDLAADVVPDLVNLNRGEQTTVNLTLDNQGSPVNVRIEPREMENLIAEAGTTSQNLGEPGTGTSEATVPLNLTVGPQAPLQGVLVLTVELQIQLGELDPVTQLLSVRVAVTPDHGLEPGAAIDALAGLEQEVELPVRATGEVDENVTLDLLEVPEGWQVSVPQRLEVPVNTTAPLRMTVTPPSGVDPGSYTLRILAQPTDGSEPVVLSTQVAIQESPAYRIQGPQALDLGAGETRSVTINVANLGNAAGEVTPAVATNLTETTLTPGSLTLAPGEDRDVRLNVTATSTGNETLRLTADPGGQAAAAVTVGEVDLDIELVSTDPATPQVGERFRAVVSVTNNGDAPARDVDLALMSGEETLAQETIGFLGPGTSATTSIVVDELSTLEDLRLVIDPANRYSQGTANDGAIALSQQDTPMLPLGAVLLIGTLVSLVARRTRR